MPELVKRAKITQTYCTMVFTKFTATDSDWVNIQQDELDDIV